MITFDQALGGMIIDVTDEDFYRKLPSEKSVDCFATNEPLDYRMWQWISKQNDMRRNNPQLLQNNSKAEFLK